MAALRAALGFRLHTGWAALVAAAVRPNQIEILTRRRIELLPADESIPRFVYHQAAELDTKESAALVKRAAAGSRQAARAAVKEILEWLRRMDIAVDLAGIPVGSTTVPADLAKILGSHPLIHAAEGALFHSAVASACEAAGLKAVTVRERDVFSRAADARGIAEPRFRQSLDDLRKTIGPPWSADQKIAAAAALLALSPAATAVPADGFRGSSRS
jgi:hypothetical protein